MERVGDRSDECAAVFGSREVTDVSACAEVGTAADEEHASDSGGAGVDGSQCRRAAVDAVEVERGTAGLGGYDDAQYAVLDADLAGAVIIRIAHARNSNGRPSVRLHRRLCPASEYGGGAQISHARNAVEENEERGRNQPRTTLPAFKQEVHTFMRLELPGAT